MKKVLVLMSTYNGEKYLNEQIESILFQKNCEVSLLVRDDGSTDNTVSILDSYKSKKMLNWYSGKNLKCEYSFMDLVYNSTTADYYAFADQDDIWDDNKISCAIQQLSGIVQPAFYHSNVRIANENGEEIGKNLYNKVPDMSFFSLVSSGGITGCTMVFNNALMEVLKNAPFPQKIRMHDYYIGMVAMGIGGKVIYDHVPHMNYRQHGNNVAGIAVGLKKKFKRKIKQFKTKAPVSIDEQASEVLKSYSERMIPEYRNDCLLVAEYKKNVRNTLRVAFSKKAKYSTIKNSIFTRFCLLCRRR